MVPGERGGAFGAAQPDWGFFRVLAVFAVAEKMGRGDGDGISWGAVGEVFHDIGQTNGTARFGIKVGIRWPKRIEAVSDLPTIPHAVPGEVAGIRLGSVGRSNLWRGVESISRMMR